MGKSVVHRARNGRRRRRHRLFAGCCTLSLLVVRCHTYDASLLGHASDGSSGSSALLVAGSPGDASAAGSVPVAGAGATIQVPEPTSGGVAGEGGAPPAGGESSAGSGGTEPVKEPPRCGDAPIPNRALWESSSYPQNEPSSRALDQNWETRWSSAAAMAGVEWFQVDFGAVTALSSVTLHHDGQDFARGYEAIFSEEPVALDAPSQLTGANSETDLVIEWPTPQLGRYLIIRQTGGAGNWWSVIEIEFECND